MVSRGRPIASVDVIDGERLVTTCTFEAGGADLTVVDAIARLALCAQRAGWEIRLIEPDPALVSLLHFVGLDDLLAQPSR